MTVVFHFPLTWAGYFAVLGIFHPAHLPTISFFFCCIGTNHIAMNYNALQSAVEDTMKWEPDTVVLSLYESLEDTTPRQYDLKQWMVPEDRIVGAFKFMSPLVVSACLYCPYG